MTGEGWVQAVLLLASVAATTPLLGRYIARVFGDGPGPLERVFGPVERLVFRASGVDPHREQTWRVYTVGVLAFSAVSVVEPGIGYRFERDDAGSA
ncbi:MAG: potassium-transporting ATPase subunit KdpA [Thermoleophilia bacterium]|nr:potassium-transporting ATPase subunit KdpA [Thermoleophilia bacterium]